MSAQVPEPHPMRALEAETRVGYARTARETEAERPGPFLQRAGVARLAAARALNTTRPLAFVFRAEQPGAEPARTWGGGAPGDASSAAAAERHEGRGPALAS